MDQRYNYKTWHPESEKWESMEHTWTYIQRGGHYYYALRDTVQALKPVIDKCPNIKLKKILKSKESNYSHKAAAHRIK